MSRTLRNFLPLATLGGLIVVSGCSSERESPASTTPAGPSVAFEAKTEGSTASLLSQLRKLDTQYQEADSADLAASRANLLAYTKAIEATGRALMAQKEAPMESRLRGAVTVLKALRDRVELDPKSFDQFLAETDRIESEYPKSELATMAAFARFQTLADESESTIPDEKERFERASQALIRLAKCDPPFPDTPGILRKFGQTAEGKGRTDLAQTLYLLVSEKFPDDQFAPYAQGSALRASMIGKPLDLSGEGFDGEVIDVKDYRGKVVIVDFWASWCGPCVKEVPLLKDLAYRLKPYGFEVVGINLDEEPERAKALIEETRTPWKQIYQKSGSEGLDAPVALRFGIAQIPFKLLIGRDGKLLATGFTMEEIGPAILAQLEPEAKKMAEQAQAKAKAEAPEKGEDAHEGHDHAATKGPMSKPAP